MKKPKISLASFNKDGEYTVIDFGRSGVMYAPEQLEKGQAKSDDENIDIKEMIKGERAKSLESLTKKLFPTFKKDSISYKSVYGQAQTEVPEGIQTAAEDFLVVPFRLLSATIVGQWWQTTDFRDEAVLRASTSMLKDQPVYTEHYVKTDNWAGKVQDTTWTPSYTQNGTTIPAGIDGLLAIDTSIDRNLDLAKGILVGAVDSNSVTVAFEWEQSHEMSEDDFYWMLGQEIDGEVVARRVTKIIKYFETSLVPEGADPFAKRIDEQGNLVRVEGTQSMRSFSADLQSGDVERIKKALSLAKAKRYQVVKDALSESDNALRYCLAASKNQEAFEISTENYSQVVASFGDNLGAYLDGLISNMVEASEDLSKVDVIKDCALQAGIAESTFRQALNGTINCPSLERLASFADFFSVNVQELITQAEKDGCSYSQEKLDELAAANTTKESKEENACDDEDKKKSMGGDEEDDEGMDYKAMYQQTQVELSKVKGELSAAKEGYKEGLEEKGNQILLHRSNYAKANVENQQLKAQVAKYKAEVEQLQDAQLELTAATQQLESLQQSVKSFEDKQELIELGQKQLDEARKAAIRLYRANLSKGEVESKEVIENLQKATSMKTLEAFAATKNKELADQFGFTCGDCGSHKYSFGSVKQAQSKSEVIGQDEFEPMDTEEFINNLRFKD